MESTRSLKNSREPHLKVIKNSSKKNKTAQQKKVFINTLMPNFSYTNSKGDLVNPLNQVHL
jgi:uncharacterized FlgJ-related protein